MEILVFTKDTQREFEVMAEQFLDDAFHLYISCNDNDTIKIFLTPEQAQHLANEIDVALQKYHQYQQAVAK